MNGNLSGMDNFDPTQRPGPAARPPVTGGRARSGRRYFTRWAAGIGAAALLAGGGIAAFRSATTRPASASTSSASGAQLTSSSLASASTAELTSAAARATISGLTQDLSPATLRTCLAKARALAKAGNKTAARQARRACLAGLPLNRRLRGEHGTVTLQTKKGPVTIAWERGQVSTAPGTGSTFAVKAPDGTIWTWTLTSKTRIRQAGKKVTAGSLSLGAKVFVFGLEPGGTDTAAIVLIAK